MPTRQDLFTIGEFSKVTGIGIHSLRYYDEIGALKPEYVDPVSNYRYYSFDQLRRMPGIAICLDAGIKLSEFDGFIENGDIDYQKLISSCRDALDQKINEYRLQQKSLSKVERLLRIRQELMDNEYLSVRIEDHDLWIMPFDDNSLDGYEIDILVKLSSHAAKRGCRISPVCFGLLRMGGINNSGTYAFAPIHEISDLSVSEQNVFHLDAGEYLLRATDNCSIRNAEMLSESVNRKAGAELLLSFILIGDSRKETLSYAALKA